MRVKYSVSLFTRHGLNPGFLGKYMPPTQDVLCHFDCTYLPASWPREQVLRSPPENPKSFSSTLPLQRSLRPNMGFAVTFYHSSRPGAPNLAEQRHHTQLGGHRFAVCHRQTLPCLGCARCLGIPRCEHWRVKGLSAHTLSKRGVCDEEKQRSPLHSLKLQKKTNKKDVYPKAKGQDYFCAVKFLTKIQGSPSCSKYPGLQDSSHPSPTRL